MATRFDARQTISRDLLRRITGAADSELDNILRVLEKEVTPPLSLTASQPADLILNIGSITVTNPETSQNKTIPPISNLLPSFTGGTVTMDATGAGNATPSVGSAVALGMSASQYLRIGVNINASGDIVLTKGTAGASLSAATNPPTVADTFAVGYFVVITNASNNVQNITDAYVYQYSGGGGGNSSNSYARIFINM